MTLPSEAEVLERLVGWGQSQPDVRALILTSSRARPGGPVDALSDYDLIVAATDPLARAEDERWHSVYGRPMVRWGDRSELLGNPTYFCGVVYTDYVKIDYTLWPASLLAVVAARPALPAELDEGYRVLLDKDGQTIRWPAPTYRAFVPLLPSAADYRGLVEQFWYTALYVAKSLWRGELMFARFCLDHEIKLEVLRPMLEWRLEMEHGWSLRPGFMGRGLMERLPADLGRALAATYVGPSAEASWQALLDSADLFRRVALEVGRALKYEYPQAVEDEVRAYLEFIRKLPPAATASGRGGG